MLKKVVYWGIALLFAVIAFLLAYTFLGPPILAANPDLYIPALILFPLIFALVGVLFAPVLVAKVESGTEKLLGALSKMSLVDIFSCALCLIAGLFIGALLGTAFGRIEVVGPYLSVIFILFFGYVGLLVGYRRREDFRNVFRLPRGEKGEKNERLPKLAAGKITPKVLDTSVIIDGRIADIYKTGFIEGELIIPQFVLDELRHIADSSDQLKRNRGRRGLDIMNKLRLEFDNTVKIVEKDYPDIAEVDSKLLRLAQDMKGVVLTNDFNLNKVAQLQDMRVLNINELSNAVKPMVLPGEELFAQIVRDGKEPGQGVAYLDDGTMIVVENGKRFMTKTILVTVTSVLQTAAGRMIFAKPKLAKNGEPIEEGNRSVS